MAKGTFVHPSIALIALFMLAATPAWAELLEIARREDQALFLDTATIQVDGTLRRAWTVCSYTAPNPDGALSTRSLMEYDCAAGRYRILMLSTHAECMGEGETLHFEAAERPWWRDTPPGTVAAKLLNRVCAK
jgi:hypothetical protein